MSKRTITADVDEDVKAWYKENSTTISGKVREILEKYKAIEEEDGTREDLSKVHLAMLKSYKTTVEKQIQVLKQERDKIDQKIEQHEEEEEPEVLVSIELDIDEYKL